MSESSSNGLMRGAMEGIRDRFVADQPRYFLFTTFNFSSQFFEANVLPLVVGDTVDDLKGTAETRRAINDELGLARCLVVCDRSTAPEPKGEMRYGLLPVGLSNGRFHPKIILAAGTLKDTGEPGLWLSVGSGNLTLSGWAINREIVGVTPVTRQHAAELIPLIEWLASQADLLAMDSTRAVVEEGGTREILEAFQAALSDSNQLAAAANDTPTLHISKPFDSRSGYALIKALRAGHRWRSATIVSPFWSGVDALVESLDVERCTFIPSINADGLFGFGTDALDPEPDYCRSFRKFKDDPERYTHAKAVLLEDSQQRRVLCMGSANFTRAAMLEPRPDELSNVEAMLRFELPPGRDPWKNAFDALDEDCLATDTEDESEEGAPALPPFDAAVVCDWRTKEFRGQVTITGRQALSNIVLWVDGRSHHVDATRLGETQTMTIGAFKGVQPVRSFSVTYTSSKQERLTFHGLVTQLDAYDDELGYSPPPRLNKVLELLRGLSVETSARKRASRRVFGRDPGDGEEEAGEPTFDFFALFQGTWKLVEFYEKAPSDGRRTNPFEEKAPFGIATLYRAITVQPAVTAEEKIGRYIQLMEVRNVVYRLEALCSEKPSDALLGQIQDEIDALRAEIESLLAASHSFRALFDATTSKKQVDGFLEWFHEELKATANVQAGCVHEQ